jgi:hypothetical protein
MSTSPSSVDAKCDSIASMRLRTAICIVAFAFGLAGCGSGGSKGTGGAPGGSCTAVTACGGDIEGTWEITSTCTIGDVNEFMIVLAAKAGTALPAACESFFEDFTLEMSGSVSFANGSIVNNTTTNIKGTEHNTPACLSATSGTSVSAISASACSSIKTRLTKSSGTCSVTAGNCDCSVSIVDNDTSSGTYAIQGNQLVLDPAGQAKSLDFCVSGETLRLTQTLPGVSDVSLVISYRRK